MPLKLDLGGGADPRPGYVNVDRLCGKEIHPLDYPDGAADEIVASHCLEHLPMRTAIAAVKDWARVLKPGGVLKIAVPDLDRIIKAVNDGNPDGWPIQAYIYGGQTDENDFHRSGYNAEWLTHLMSQAGLTDIKPWVSDRTDCASLPVSLNLMGTKPDRTIKPARQAIPKTSIVMSMPRLAFSDNMHTVVQIAVSRQLGFKKVTGAFWGQCLTRGMEEYLSDGTEWLLLVDYDTIAGVEEFDALAALMLAHPEADAIAPVQVKRDESNLLLGLVKPDGEPYPHGTPILVKHFDPELVRVSWAHCGFTFLRTAALRKLPKPWFHSTPDKDGGWGEGRVDDDIWFWNQWRKAGNTLYLASHVPIGHGQFVVTWPTQDLKPFHQYATDYNHHGKPTEARQ